MYPRDNHRPKHSLDALRRPVADNDFSNMIGSEEEIYYQDTTYTRSNAGFRPGTNRTISDQSNPGQKISYLKAEMDYMIDGFMRELLDLDAFSNLDPQIQQEIINRYPQFFN